jgi:hypothetical protein
MNKKVVSCCKVIRLATAISSFSSWIFFYFFFKLLGVKKIQWKGSQIPSAIRNNNGIKDGRKMRWLVCVCIVGWHETAPITLILPHLGNQLSFASTSSCQAKYGPIKTLYTRLSNMTQQRLDCILLVTIFFPYSTGVFCQGKNLIFFVTRSDGSHVVFSIRIQFFYLFFFDLFPSV